MPSSTPNKSSSGLARRILKRIAIAPGYVLGFFVLLWSFGFITYCGPFPGLGNLIIAIVWTLAISWFLLLRSGETRLGFGGGLGMMVFISFWSLQPSHDRDWVEPQAKTSSATVTGDILDIHNFRSFDYDSEGLPVGKWESRSYDLKKLKGMDFFMTHWTTDLAGHPIFSFDFGDQGHLAFTIEARLEKDEKYSLLAGLYPRYELIYIPCPESDAVRVRTNFRENENVYLYRTIATPKQARARLLEFVATLNDIAENPRFYNVITSNCTTAVRSQMTGGFPFDWRIIINGKLDEMLYDRGLLETAGLPFDELKRRGFINPKVREHPEKKNFSTRIREGVPGF